MAAAMAMATTQPRLARHLPSGRRRTARSAVPGGAARQFGASAAAAGDSAAAASTPAADVFYDDDDDIDDIEDHETTKTKTSTTASKTTTTTRRRRSGVRNVAVIAHVDHGKTTLVDRLLQSSSSSSSSTKNNGATAQQQPSLNRLLDAGDLEKERGITITSKVTRLTYEHASNVDCDGDETTTTTTTTVINVVDTPGHADFSAEVDRVLSTVDGVLLVVDAAEGPKSQTKYVLRRALAQGLKPVVVLNKCDRHPEATDAIDSGDTEDKLLRLMQALGADDDQMGYVTWYASARDGWVTDDPLRALELAEEWANGGGGGGTGGGAGADDQMTNLLDSILHQIPEPAVTSYRDVDGDSNSGALAADAFANDPFGLAAVSVGYDQYLGRTCTGRIASGCVRVGDPVSLLRRTKGGGGGSNDDDDEEDEDSSGTVSLSASSGTVSGIFVYKGIDRIPLENASGDGPAVAYAGDIVTLTGIPDDVAVGDTLTRTDDPVPEPIATPPLAPPTLAMEFGANDGPTAGTEGTKVTSSQIRDRLMSEADNNVTLKVQISESDREKTTVFARGELQLGILAETMRREGYEFVISPPRILMKECPDTKAVLEPFEEVTVDVDSEHASTVVSTLTGDRKGVLLESATAADGRARLDFEVPSRGLLGFQTEIATLTRGSAVVNHLYLEHREHCGNLGTGLDRGKLVSNSSGKATTYALSSLAQRGKYRFTIRNANNASLVAVLSSRSCFSPFFNQVCCSSNRRSSYTRGW